MNNKALQDKIKYFNQEYDRINAELNKHGMRLVANAILKGQIPNSEYMGHISNYKAIIQSEIDKASFVK